MCIRMKNTDSGVTDSDCRSSATFQEDKKRDSYDETRLRYVLTASNVLAEPEKGNAVTEKLILLKGLTNPGLASGSRQSDASIKLAVWIALGEEAEPEYFIVEVFYFGLTILDPI